MAAPCVAETAAVLLSLTGLVTIATLGSCNTEATCDILYAQRQAWEDPNNAMHSWDPTLFNPCTWFRITCNDDNSVIRVDMENAGISGPLIALLGGLKNLQYLELYGNHLNGSIPPTLGKLNRLVSLDLQDNQLSGTIPSSLGAISVLWYLRLNGNMLTGTIPFEILSLVLAGNLAELNVQINNLDGTVRKPGMRVTRIVQDIPKTSS